MATSHGGNNNRPVVHVHRHPKSHGYEKAKPSDGGCKKRESDGCLSLSDLASWLAILHIVLLLDNMTWVPCDEASVVTNAKNSTDACLFDEPLGKTSVFVYSL